MDLVRDAARHGRDFWRALSHDDVSDSAAGLSYRFLLALFPFFIFTAALAGIVSRLLDVQNPSAEVLVRFGDALPSDARSLMAGELTNILETQRPGLLSIGLVGALWAASGGVGATMRAMNRVYGVEETRPFWRRTLLAFALTLVGGAFFISAFVLAIAGQAIARAVADSAGLGDFTRAILFVVRLLLVIGLMLTAIAFLYWAAPNAHLPFQLITPGAVLFTGAWLLVTVLFGWYVSHFASYNATYGALGGVVALMVWFYLTAYLMLAGAELNAMLARRTAPEVLDATAPEADAWRSVA